MSTPEIGTLVQTKAGTYGEVRRITTIQGAPFYVVLHVDHARTYRESDITPIEEDPALRRFIRGTIR